MNKKYFLAIAAVAVSAALYSCGSGDVVDFYNDDIDGVPGQAMLDEMNFTNTLQDESVVNNYKDKYGNGSVPPPESSSSVDPIPTDSTPTGGGEIPLSSSSQGPILPPVSSSEKSSSSSSSAPEEIPTLSSSSSSLAESSSSSIAEISSSSSSDQTPVSSSSANSGESLEPVTCQVGEKCTFEYGGAEMTLPDSGMYQLNFSNPHDAYHQGSLFCKTTASINGSTTVARITMDNHNTSDTMDNHNTSDIIVTSNNTTKWFDIPRSVSSAYIHLYLAEGATCEQKW